MVRDPWFALLQALRLKRKTKRTRCHWSSKFQGGPSRCRKAYCRRGGKRLPEGEIEGLQDQMETRKIVGRAKAILMERQGLAEREAFRRLQAQSLAMNKSLKEIADAIILTDELNVASR